MPAQENSRGDHSNSIRSCQNEITTAECHRCASASRSSTKHSAEVSMTSKNQVDQVKPVVTSEVEIAASGEDADNPADQIKPELTFEVETAVSGQDSKVIKAQENEALGVEDIIEMPISYDSFVEEMKDSSNLVKAEFETFSKQEKDSPFCNVCSPVNPGKRRAYSSIPEDDSFSRKDQASYCNLSPPNSPNKIRSHSCVPVISSSVESADVATVDAATATDDVVDNGNKNKVEVYEETTEEVKIYSVVDVPENSLSGASEIISIKKKQSKSSTHSSLQQKSKPFVKEFSEGSLGNSSGSDRNQQGRGGHLWTRRKMSSDHCSSAGDLHSSDHGSVKYINVMPPEEVNRPASSVN